MQKFEEILNSFQAEIICFQEIKSSRTDLPEEFHTLTDYYCFYDLNTKGSNGVGTFVKREFCPIKVEIGFSSGDLGSMEELAGSFTAAQLRELDSEGRCVITDHVTFILFNVYFPCFSMKRAKFKNDFSRAVQIRIDSFIKSGRSVILAADVNVMHREIDCYSVEQYLAEHDLKSLMSDPYRQWFDDWLKTTMIDTFRHFYPDKPHTYTVWNTRENKRPTNQGTRIDYILSSRDLVERFQDTIVQSNIMGSDHAPVVSTLDNCLLIPYQYPKPPKGCTFYWKNYGEKQKTLDSFFKNHSAETATGYCVTGKSFEMLDKKIVSGVRKKPYKTMSKILSKDNGAITRKSQKSILSFLQK